MTLVNTETGELISAEEVRESIARVIAHAESIWDEWAWQVENRTWTVLGYSSWDAMRSGEYGSLSSVVAPRAERPELVARFRGAGLTQKETAATLGVAVPTVKRAEHPEWKGSNDPSGPADDEPKLVSATEALAERTAPKPIRRATENAEVTLVNDLRGPWHHGLIDAARAMTPEGRAHVIAALEATINRLKEI